jgi:tetratricopeptide (TPR) repeat protein
MQQIQALWEQGLRHHQGGNLLEAKNCYAQALEIDPLHFDSLYLSSAIAAQENNIEVAVNFLNRALAINPLHIDALFNLSVLLEKIGGAEKALSTYELLNQLAPNHVQSRYNYASLLAKIGHVPNAINEFKKVIELQPDLLIARQNYEKLLWSQSRQVELASNNKSEFIQAHNKGLSLLEENQFPAALEYFDRALMLEPTSFEGHHNKGMALEKMGRLQEALNHYQKAIECYPESSRTFNNLGNAYRELDLLDEAISSLKKAIELDPNYAEAFSNLGWTLFRLQKYQQSKEYFKKAIEINPTLSPAIFNLSLCQLTLGEFDEGWIHYEERMKQPLYQKKIDPLNKPQWNGSQGLEGRTIYIHSEQGLGDTIQFCRYIKLIANRGAKVLFEPQIQLQGLLKNIDGISQLLEPGQAMPPYDYHCPLMSLPLAFKTNQGSIPNDVPYLFADENKKNYWKEKLAAISGPKVGLVWSGGFRPNNPELWGVNQRRNISFELISQLNIEGIEFFSLQKGEGAEAELKKYKDQLWKSNNLHNFTDELKDFSDTAALIDQLDLVISVDTSTAHLAGAMGKPVWILNRFDGCWRWLSDGDTSDWYPSAIIFRQKKSCHWNELIQDIKKELSNVLEAKN